jgi:UDP-2,3-diacylglucosamine hydrolase
LGKLAEICDAGIPVTLFTGNHDMWMFRYFTSEIGIRLERKPQKIERFGKKILIGHGDGLGPGDHGYKFIKRVFACKLNQWLYARFHPNFAIGLGLFFSRRSRLARGDADFQFKGADGERLFQYANEVVKKEYFDFFIFGHRHLPLDMAVGANSRYINTGDWISHFSYAVMDASGLGLKRF